MVARSRLRLPYREWSRLVDKPAGLAPARAWAAMVDRLVTGTLDVPTTGELLADLTAYGRSAALNGKRIPPDQWWRG